MSPAESSLYAFAVLLMASLTAAVMLPYLWGRTDLASASNAFLVGGAVFVGLSSVDCAISDSHYATYRSGTFYAFIASATWFFLVYLAAYHWLKAPRRLGSQLFRKWPEPSWYVTVAVLAFVIGLVALNYVIRVPVLSQIITQLTLKAGPFCVVIAFAAWYRDRKNVILLALFLSVVFGALMIAVLVGGSRKPFLGVVAAVPICYYWYRGRSRPRAENLLYASGAVAGIAVVMIAYGQTRWFDLGRDAKERNLETSAEQLSNTVNNVAEVDLVKGVSKFGQNATEVSLYCIHRTRKVDPAWFEALYLVAVNPVPRSMWRDKPIVLGKAIVSEVINNDRVNWGPGIVGHGYHEGGMLGSWLMLAFYGVFIGSLMSCADSCLASQPGNPFLIATLCASFPNLVAMPRGDLTTAMIQLIGAVLLLVVVQVFAVTVFGAKREMQPSGVYWARVPS